MLLANSAHPPKMTEMRKKTHFFAFLLNNCHCTTNTVNLDQNGNAIIALISKIIVSTMVIVGTLILSKIPIR